MIRRDLIQRVLQYDFARYFMLFSMGVRGGLESWLQVELVDALQSADGSYQREVVYPGTNHKADFKVDQDYVEIKCLNFGESNTYCASRYLTDLKKVHDKSENCFCVLIFVGSKENMQEAIITEWANQKWNSDIIYMDSRPKFEPYYESAKAFINSAITFYDTPTPNVKIAIYRNTIEEV